MPIATREAEIVWEGPLESGAGICRAGVALSLMLGENHTPPERLTVSAACTLDEVDGAPRITTVELAIRARVSGLDQAGFEQAVERAAALCPVSNALRDNVVIGLRSELEP